MEQLLPEENKSVKGKIWVLTVSTVSQTESQWIQSSSWRPFFRPCSRAGFEFGGLVESANKGQTAKVQAINETLSFCWYFLLPSLLNCTILFFFSLCPLLYSFQVHRYAFNLLHFLLALILSLFCFTVSFFQQHHLLFNNPPYIYLSLSPRLALLTFFFSSGLCSRPCGGWGLAASSPDSVFSGGSRVQRMPR